ncbi:MAG: 6-carboxytetrahydropterin synthase QueD [Candidatus Rokubacteria bacterium]|nr:6-carboxytetrahydropterin synthase QueD [Candidatus Rokubacteria bacterium]
MNLTTRFTFDAAHRILGHQGKCAYLHGHTYHLEVTISAERLDPLGMVIDFDDLRALVRKAVLDRWDHATLLAEQDPLVPAIAGVQAEAPEKVVTLSQNPTAEILTRTAWEAIRQALPPGVRLLRVKIEETPACSSELTADSA